LVGPALALAALVAGCAAPASPYPDLPRLEVKTAFAARNLCGLGILPAINVMNPPRDVARYTIKITSIDVLIQTPWTATVPAVSTGVAEGTAPDYYGPCPGELQTFRYRFEVLALDAADQPLGYGLTIAQTGSLGKLVRAQKGAPGLGGTGAETPAEPGGARDLLFGTAYDRGFLPVLVPSSSEPEQ
jgi:hypothetical protein